MREPFRIQVIVLGMLFVSLSNSSYAQKKKQEVDFKSISEVLAAGSARELMAFVNKTVELNINGEEASYSKPQAEGVLKNFFTDNPPTSFQISHKGASSSGLPYAIGQYNYNGGKYRVWIRFRLINQRYLIHGMSFIKE